MDLTNHDDWSDLFYAAREAEIRFRRLRTRLYQGEEGEICHWTIEECDEKIRHYRVLQNKLSDCEPPRKED